MKIGSFISGGDGSIHGKIYGLGIGVTSVIFKPQTSHGGKEYFRIIADPLQEAYEIGAAFRKEKNGRTFYSVNIESPTFPAAINAALFSDNDGRYNLVWNRQEVQNARLENGSQSKHASSYQVPKVN